MDNEIYMLTVKASYYRENYEVFKPPNTILKSIVVESDKYKNDEIHKSLLKKHLKARNELRDYEYDLRHKIKK